MLLNHLLLTQIYTFKVLIPKYILVIYTVYGENPWNTGVNSAMLTNPFIYYNAGNVNIGTINMLHII